MYTYGCIGEMVMVWCGFNIGIKHNFPFINICLVPRGVLKTKGVARGFQHSPGDLANVNE